MPLTWNAAAFAFCQTGRSSSSTTGTFVSKASSMASDWQRETLDVARVVGEDVHSVLGDDHGVRVTEAADSPVIEAWLDREDHARLERRVIADIEEGRLVVAEPDRVAGVLAPVPGQVVLLEVAHDCAVHVGAGSA